ncbi:hypothetical protein BDZ94DRAFT_403622 [Collybia nuda]|uniref:Uncharacterized protein n=1 Tax=Collybia nuda TaxID=64659 RepID=A0A9P5XRG5_9AGAR|nr:hypothetical protein BDZ94DRAFT_403622 [Collybia nuda]
MKLQEEVKRLREAEGLHVSDLRIPMADTRRSPIIEPTLYAPSSSGSDYEMKLSKAAISEPDSFFVSPLPEFSNKGLSTVSMDLFSLPDVVYEVDNKPHRASSGKDPICDSKYHPTACRCVQAPPAHEAPHSVMVASTPNSSRSRGSSIVDRPSASDPSIDRSPIYAAPLVHSSSSFGDDNPRYRPQRTTSRSSRPSSLSRPPSRPPTRPSSPSRRSVSSQQVQNRIPSPMDAATSPRANMTLPQPGQNKVNNPRLHDLLQDSNSATISSSLPNMTSHFPPVISRDSHSSRSRDHVDSPTRSRSRSISGHRSSLPSPPQVREAHPATVIPDPPPQTTTPPSSSYMNPGTVVSTASNAASLLEKAKKERRREEEERQREREKEQSRREREKARDKLERERDRGGRERDKAERERDIERDREKVEKEQRREEKRTRERQTSSASSSYPAISAHREQFPTNPYAGAMPVSVPYDSQRISTTSSSSRSGSGTLRDSYNVHKHTTNALPVLGTTRV